MTTARPQAEAAEPSPPTAQPETRPPQLTPVGQAFLSIASEAHALTAGGGRPAIINEEFRKIEGRVLYAAWLLERGEGRPRFTRQELIVMAEIVYPPALRSQISDAIDRLIAEGRLVQGNDGLLSLPAHEGPQSVPNGPRPAVRRSQLELLEALCKLFGDSEFTASQAAEALGLSRPDAHQRLGRLRARGLVEYERANGRGYWRLAAPCDSFVKQRTGSGFNERYAQARTGPPQGKDRRPRLGQLGLRVLRAVASLDRGLTFTSTSLGIDRRRLSDAIKRINRAFRRLFGHDFARAHGRLYYVLEASRGEVLKAIAELDPPGKDRQGTRGAPSPSPLPHTVGAHGPPLEVEGPYFDHVVGTTVWGDYVEGRRGKDWTADKVSMIKDLDYAEVTHIFRGVRIPGAYVLYTPKGANYVREEWRPPSGYYRNRTAADAVKEKYRLRNQIIEWLGWAQLRGAPQWALSGLARAELSHLEALGYRCARVGPSLPVNNRREGPAPAELPGQEALSLLSLHYMLM